MIINLWLHACNVENGNYEMGEHKNKEYLVQMFSVLYCVCGDSRCVFPLYVTEAPQTSGISLLATLTIGLALY